MTDPIGTAQERELIEAVLEQSDDEIAFEELHRIYNFTDDDTKQFTRWQMIVAYRHGFRLGKELIEELVSKAYERGWNEGCETMLDANEIDGAIMYPHKDARNEGCGTYMNEARAALSLQRRV